MKNTKPGIIACMLILCCIAAMSAYGKDDTKVKGMIIGRSGDHMTIRTMDGTPYKILLTDDTKVQVPKGVVRRQEMSWSTLIPGLAVEVKGNKNPQGQVVASEVNFTKESLQTASMIQAGLVPTENQVTANQQQIAANQQKIAANQQAIAANQQAILVNQQNIGANTQQIAANEQETHKRFAELADYDMTAGAVVYFTPGSSTISDTDKAALTLLADSAKGVPGYLVQVKGFADSSGSLAMNQTLSRTRAEAVIAYLMQSCKISPRHIVAPGAMGISEPSASNETADGRAENRRVEVTVLVNKGVTGL